MTAIYSTDMLAANLAPLLLSDIKFLFPMEIPKVDSNKTIGYLANYLTQSFCLTTYGTLYGIYCLIFIIFSVHLLQELKVIHKFCRDVGKYEKIQIALTLVQSKMDKEKAATYKGHCSKTDSKFDHAFEEFKREVQTKETDFHKSSILLQKIIELHNDDIE